MAHHQLRLEEREFIAEKLAAGWPQRQIAQALGRSGSTISDELRRNGLRGCYSPSIAQALACRRRLEAGRKRRKLGRVEVREFVIRHLRLCWSPEQIAGETKWQFSDNSRRQLSAQTIYTWIAQDDHSLRWRKLLRRTRRPKRRCLRPNSQACVGLAQRPAIINERGRFGDWEGDTILGCRPHGGALISLVERKSGLVELIPVTNLQSHTVSRAIRQRLAKYPWRQRQSITFDRGSEFTEHAWLAEHLHLEVYFADPRSPWQRGTNENTNGLVRQFFPKGTNFQHVSRRKIEQVQNLLNHRPRKRHAFKTPSDILQQDSWLRIHS